MHRVRIAGLGNSELVVGLVENDQNTARHEPMKLFELFAAKKRTSRIIRIRKVDQLGSRADDICERCQVVTPFLVSDGAVRDATTPSKYLKALKRRLGG